MWPAVWWCHVRHRRAGWQNRFWLNRDHLPEFAAVLAGFPSLAGMADWRRPAAYPGDHVRRASSVWTRVGPEAEQRAVRSLSDDLDSGRWAERSSDLVHLDAAGLGLRLLIS